MRTVALAATLVMGLADRAAAQAPAATAGAPAPGEAGYDKGFYVRSADQRFSLTIGGRVQPYLTIARTVTPATNLEDRRIDHRGSLELRRARLVLDGSLHDQAIRVRMQPDFGGGNVRLRDFFIDVRLADQVWLRAGQWKRPFSRQQITSFGRLEISDRSITDRAFGAGRDLGVALRNDYEKSPALEWTVGVFNGFSDLPRLTGTTMSDDDGVGTITGGGLTNVPAKLRPALVGRIGFNRGGLKGYSEADLEGGGLRWGAAASVWLEGDFDDDARATQRAQLDGVVKVARCSFTAGLYVLAAAPSGGDAFADTEIALVGGHVQGGVMVAPRWQLAARTAWVGDVRTRTPMATDQRELALAVNFYAVGHDAKLGAAIRQIDSNASMNDDTLVEISTVVGF